MGNPYKGKWKGVGQYSSTIEVDFVFSEIMCKMRMKRIEKGSVTTYTGLGILFNGTLYVSRIHSSEANFKPIGGIGIYSPVGDTNSFYALWTSFRIYDKLGSGVGVKKSDHDIFYEGQFYIQYYDVVNGFKSFDLIIDEINEEEGISLLNWSSSGKTCLRGIGMKDEENMALAWGDPDLAWEIVKYKLAPTNKSKMNGWVSNLADNKIMKEELLLINQEN